MRTLKARGKVREALKHVRSLHPDVWVVKYTRKRCWVYLDSWGKAPMFDYRVNIILLEEALAEVCSVPVKFYL